MLQHPWYKYKIRVRKQQLSDISVQYFIVPRSGAKTSKIVKNIRENPFFPIIATGGPNPENILNTIQSGANTITFTTPTTSELLMNKL